MTGDSSTAGTGNGTGTGTRGGNGRTADGTTAGTGRLLAGEEVDWQDYLAAAQRLDAVRRGSEPAGSGPAGSGPAETIRAARDELARLRARLALQHAQLRALGVPEDDLRPTAAELAAVAEPMAAGPEPVLAALRQARTTVAATDGRMVGAGWSVRLGAAIRRRAAARHLVLLAVIVVALVGCLGVAAVTLLS
ncbi:hypothetical protein O7627_01860 [Solwaraspora sp. WMMD1047]|uniref:hypothetical protein n=1 Tax=Solwaraspora sp. WMMD1047 TaxID=3016102 RepID=UPI0024168485|nr:hypothetical protein [Solwaraspora sp. WMMD1047]MDG4828047.1 hypothetical protein [Solwaraspora sp. WMMD1047]